MKRRLLSVLMCVCFVLGLIPVGVFSVSAAWSDDAETTWFGDGTASGFTINTAEDLAGLASLVNINGISFEGKTVSLSASINLSAYEWVPIGCFADDTCFSGIFDGGGNTVSGINITGDYDASGLFGILNGTVLNLSASVDISAQGANVGSIAGINNGSVINCSAAGTLTSQGNYIGGIVGYNYSNVFNCYNSVAVTSPVAPIVGGVVGTNDGTMANCYNYALIVGNGSTSSGGIVSRNYGTVSNSYWLDSSAPNGIAADEGTSSNVYFFVHSDLTTTLRYAVDGKTELMDALNSWVSNNLTDTPSLLSWRRAESTSENNGYPVFDNSDYWPNYADTDWYGNGTEGSFTITTAEELAGLALLVNTQSVTFNNKQITLAGNIDVSAHEWVPIASSDSSSFRGTFNGNDCTVSGISIKGNYSSTGLFGNILSATVKNLNVSANISTDMGNVGGLAGSSVTSTISRCGVSGSVHSSGDNVGGLIGSGSCTVSDSYNTSSVSGDEHIGGLIGSASTDNVISNCYNTGSVSGRFYIGGIAGDNYGIIQNVYNAGTITSENLAGSIIGCNYNTATNCFWFQGSCSTGIGGNEGSLEHIYPFTRSGTICSLGSPIDEVTDLPTILSIWVNANNSSFLIWRRATTLTENNGFPMFSTASSWADTADTSWYNSAASSFQINTAEKLAGFALLVNNGTTNFSNKTITLTANIDLSACAWIPIGASDSEHAFAGTFEGNNKTVTGINIVGGYSYVGFFGYNSGEVRNISISCNIDTLGCSNVGGIAGYNAGSLIKCFVSGSIGGSDNTGGIVGFNKSNSSVTSSCNSASVTGTLKIVEGAPSGTANVGGIVGYSEGNVLNCSNIGSVTGSSSVGGIAGYSNIGNVENCSNLGSVVGNSRGVGGLVGTNYSELKNSYNAGNVTGDDYMPGGITSSNYKTVSNCYWLASSCQEGCNNASSSASSSNVYSFTQSGTTCTLSSSVGTSSDLLKVLNNYASSDSDLSSWRGAESTSENEGFPLLISVYDSGGIIGEGDFYLLYSISDIVNFATAARSNTTAKAKLMRNIDFNGATHTPIGTSSVPFNGTFLGNGYTISNFNVSSSSSYQGFFGVVGSSATISDITFENCTVSASGSYAGIICGQTSSGLSNCNVLGGKVSGSNYVGGLIGNDSSSSTNYVQGCTSSAAVYGSGSHVGGLIGSVTKANVINCRSSGGVLSGGSDIGGIAGSISNDANIANCINLANIRASSSSASNIGGIVGSSESKVVNCVNGGGISSSGSTAGGIVGTSTVAAVTRNCYYLSGVASNALSSLVGTRLYNYAFSGSGTSWTLSGSLITGTGSNKDLTDALNWWVSENTGDYNNALTSWRDATSVNESKGLSVNNSDSTSIGVRLDVSMSGITITSSDFTYLGSTLSYTGAVYILSGTTSSNSVTVSGGTKTIMLNSTQITSSSPLTISGSTTANLYLNGTNNFRASGSYAGLSVSSASTVTINGNGTASFLGGSASAGIGGNSGATCGIITISEGTIVATGAGGGAGIGGGNNGGGGTIIIDGGKITATGQSGGAGIGGGNNGIGGKISINNGTVTANGGDLGSDIGNGSGNTSADSSSNYVKISGGNIAVGNDTVSPLPYSEVYGSSGRQRVAAARFDFDASLSGLPVSFIGNVPSYYNVDGLCLNDAGTVTVWLPIQNYDPSIIYVGGDSYGYKIDSDGTKLNVVFGNFYTFTYIINGVSQVVLYEQGATITVPEIPDIADYTTEGWIPDIPDVMPDENLTVTALYSGAWHTNNNGTHSRTRIPAEYNQTVDCVYSDVVTEPTDTLDGYTTHTCSVCGYSFTDTVVPARGHDFSEEWTTDENSHWHMCTRCDEISALGEHTWEWVVDTPSTCTETGLQHEECSVCQLKRNENTVLAVSTTLHSHYNEDGFCVSCNGYQPAELNSNDQYEIGNIGQLYWFAEKVNSGSVDIDALLIKDITINNKVLNSSMALIASHYGLRTWTPIGSNENPYTGIFDGNGYTISGVYINASANYNGFFSATNSNSIIRGLTLLDTYVLGNTGGGALCGRSHGLIENCFIKANVSGQSYIGGIAGSSYGTIRNTGAVIYVDCMLSGVGGIACMVEGTIENCFVAGTLLCAGSFATPTAPISNFGVSSESIYYLDTMYSTMAGIGGVPVSAEQLGNGNTAWLLNQVTADGITANSGMWSQGNDGYPILADSVNLPVYKINYTQSIGGTIGGQEYAKAGSTVTSTAQLSDNYACVLYLNGTAIDKNTFTMPAADCEVTARFTFNATQKIWGIEITSSASSVTINGKLQLSAVSIPSGDPVDVTWSTSGAVASVDNNGLVTGLKRGATTITAVDGSGNSATYSVRVISITPSVTIFSPSGTFEKKLDWWKSYSKTTLSLDFNMYNCQNVARFEWTSSNNRVKVDKNGTITNTGLFSRSATITLTAYDADNNVLAQDSVKVSFYKFSWQKSKLKSQSIVSDNVAQQGLSENELEAAEPAESGIAVFLLNIANYFLSIFKRMLN